MNVLQVSSRANIVLTFSALQDLLGRKRQLLLLKQANSVSDYLGQLLRPRITRTYTFRFPSETCVSGDLGLYPPVEGRRNTHSQHHNREP